MREVLYKNLTSIERMKKDILLQEVSEKDGVVARTERRCFYFIKSISHLNGEEDFKKWVNVRDNTDYANKRRFFIFKKHSDDLGEDKLICKIAGTFYAVVNRDVYTIAFLHSFKVSFVKTLLT